MLENRYLAVRSCGTPSFNFASNCLANDCRIEEDMEAADLVAEAWRAASIEFGFEEPYSERNAKALGVAALSMSGRGMTVKQESLTYVPAWIARVSELARAGREEQALLEVMSHFHNVKSSGEYARLSADLRLLNLEFFSDVILIALVRGSYAIRKLVPSWGELLSSIRQIMLARGRNPAKVLRGLSADA